MTSDNPSRERQRERDSYSGAGMLSHPNDIQPRGRDGCPPPPPEEAAVEAAALSDRQAAYLERIRCSLDLGPYATIEVTWLSGVPFATVRTSPAAEPQCYRVGHSSEEPLALTPCNNPY
jgi:hypothetical protein